MPAMREIGKELGLKTRSRPIRRSASTTPPTCESARRPPSKGAPKKARPGALPPGPPPRAEPLEPVRWFRAGVGGVPAGRGRWPRDRARICAPCHAATGPAPAGTPPTPTRNPPRGPGDLSPGGGSRGAAPPWPYFSSTSSPRRVGAGVLSIMTLMQAGLPLASARSMAPGRSRRRSRPVRRGRRAPRRPDRSVSAVQLAAARAVGAVVAELQIVLGVPAARRCRPRRRRAGLRRTAVSNSAMWKPNVPSPSTANTGARGSATRAASA